MANLAMLFKQAEKQLTYASLRQTDTMEVLEMRDARGYRFAWRPLSGVNHIQLYPPYTMSRQYSWDGDDFVIRSYKSECRYHDPHHKLTENYWSYVGCDCSDISEDIVFSWIVQAYECLKRDKGIK